MHPLFRKAFLFASWHPASEPSFPRLSPLCPPLPRPKPRRAAGAPGAAPLPPTLSHCSCPGARLAPQGSGFRAWVENSAQGRAQERGVGMETDKTQGEETPTHSLPAARLLEGLLGTASSERGNAWPQPCPPTPAAQPRPCPAPAKREGPTVQVLGGQPLGDRPQGPWLQLQGQPVTWARLVLSCICVSLQPLPLL